MYRRESVANSAEGLRSTTTTTTTPRSIRKLNIHGHSWPNFATRTHTHPHMMLLRGVMKPLIVGRISKFFPPAKSDETWEWRHPPDVCWCFFLHSLHYAARLRNQPRVIRMDLSSTYSAGLPPTALPSVPAVLSRQRNTSGPGLRAVRWWMEERK